MMDDTISRRRELLNGLLFFSGKTVSVLFSGVYAFVMGLYVLKVTGSGLSFAVTIAIQVLPTVLFSPIAGVLADRLDKKKIIILADLINGLAFLALYWMSIDGLSLGMIYGITLIVSSAQTLFNISMDAATPNIVSQGNLLRLNAAGSMVDSVTAVVSPFLGGLLYAVADIRLFILVNGLSFLFSAASECLIDFKLYGGGQEQRDTPHFFRDMSVGAAYVFKTPWLRQLLSAFVLINLCMALLYAVPLPYILNQQLGLSPNQYGLVQAALPVGMVLGALAVGRVLARWNQQRLIRWSGLSFGGLMCLMGLYPVLFTAGWSAVAWYGLLLLCLGFLISLVDIPFINRLQRDVPESVRGRALAISISLVKIVAPIGYLVSGLLLGFLPAHLLPLVGGPLSILAFLLLQPSKASPQA